MKGNNNFKKSIYKLKALNTEKWQDFTERALNRE